jgi:hypothetical protein
MVAVELMVAYQIIYPPPTLSEVVSAASTVTFGSSALHTFSLLSVALPSLANNRPHSHGNASVSLRVRSPSLFPPSLAPSLCCWLEPERRRSYATETQRRHMIISFFRFNHTSHVCIRQHPNFSHSWHFASIFTNSSKCIDFVFM